MSVGSLPFGGRRPPLQLIQYFIHALQKALPVADIRPLNMQLGFRCHFGVVALRLSEISRQVMRRYQENPVWKNDGNLGQKKRPDSF